MSDWDAATYDRIADPMFRWGVEVVGRLELEGSERVLDAGCGSGRVTEVLLEHLSSGSVVALDVSPAMLQEARSRLERFGDRVLLLQADLGEPLPIEDLVDAVLSTATFHWVRDHDALFRNLAAVMRPGAQLEAQCGAAGNIRAVNRAAAEAGVNLERPMYAAPEETSTRLQASGFTDIRVWTREEPTKISPNDRLETFLRTVCLRRHVDELPPDERGRFVRRVAERLPNGTIDYVRLNIHAIRA